MLVLRRSLKVLADVLEVLASIKVASGVRTVAEVRIFCLHDVSIMLPTTRVRLLVSIAKYCPGILPQFHQT
jgi:hypothetical protein